MLLSYKMLSKELTEENIRLAQIVGWCVEMLQSFLISKFLFFQFLYFIK